MYAADIEDDQDEGLDSWELDDLVTCMSCSQDFVCKEDDCREDPVCLACIDWR